MGFVKAGAVAKSGGLSRAEANAVAAAEREAAKKKRSEEEMDKMLQNLRNRPHRTMDVDKLLEKLKKQRLEEAGIYCTLRLSAAQLVYDGCFLLSGVSWLRVGGFSDKTAQVELTKWSSGQL